MDSSKPKQRLVIPDKLLPGQSGVRSLLSSTAGEPYVSFADLDDARRRADSALVFEGDWGGTVYLTMPVRRGICDEGALAQLLSDIDTIAWRESDGANSFYELLPIGTRVAGGMGGSVVIDGLWLHPKIEAVGIRSEIEEVLAGVRPSITVSSRRW